MSLKDLMAQNEERFNKLKELHTERQEAIQKAQGELLEIEREMILVKGKHEAYAEMATEEESEVVEEGK